MFCKLALRNALRSYRDYTVYFLTLVFGVCLFYTFNALDSQQVLVMMARSRHYMVDAIMEFVAVFSVFVSVVLACLVLYANSFLMKRRKKELGVYLLLGLPTGRVSLLLVLETLLLGLVALAAGLALGVLASQGLNVASIALFSADPGLSFVFSPGALGKTVLYFSLIFAVVMAFTGLSVSRAKLIDLMRGGRKNEELRERPLWISALLFVLGVLLLAVAYRMLLTRGLLVIDNVFFLMLALGTAGTLLFFRSLSGFLLRLVKGRPGVYFKGLNMFVLRQFNSRIHTAYLSMTVVCLMLLLAIGITATSVGLNDTLERLTTGTSPYDLTLMNYGYQGTAGEQSIGGYLESAGLSEADFAAASVTFTLYYNDPAVTGMSEDDCFGALRRPDYDALLALLGMAPAVRGADEIFLVEIPVMNHVTEAEWVAVVPGGLEQTLEIRRQVANYTYLGDKQAAEERVMEALKTLSLQGAGLMDFSRLDQYWENMGSKILALYLGLYLGILFLVTAAAVLALQQLSQAADNAPRYRVLSRLGAEKGMQDRSVLLQVGLAFSLPLALALVHAWVGMTAANEVIAVVGKVDAWAGTLAAAGLLVLVYGAYFLATYLGSRRVVRGN